MPSRLPNGSKSRWRGLALCAVLLLAGASVLHSQETTSADQAPESDRMQTARKAVERLSGPVNIHTLEWRELPEPEFTNLLVEAINTGRFSNDAALERSAKELAIRRLRQYPDKIYPILRETIRDPGLQERYILAVSVLSGDFREIALRDVRLMVEEGLLAAETEAILHTAYFGSDRDPNNPWAMFARERFKDASVPLNVRITAGAYWYSCEDPDLVIKDASTAVGSSRDAAIGALARFIRGFQTNSVLGFEENLIVARDLVSRGLSSEAKEVRKWAAYASFYVTFQFGYLPLVVNVGTPDERTLGKLDEKMRARIEEAKEAEQDPEIRDLLGEALGWIEQVPKAD